MQQVIQKERFAFTVVSCSSVTQEERKSLDVQEVSQIHIRFENKFLMEHFIFGKMRNSLWAFLSYLSLVFKFCVHFRISYFSLSNIIDNTCLFLQKSPYSSHFPA